MGIVERVSPFSLINPRTDYETWELDNNSAPERGKLAKAIIEQYSNCENLNVLNLGPDNGNAAKLFSQKNKVVCFDISYLRLKKHTEDLSCQRVEGDFLLLPFKCKSFDLIIIQNVIEQVYEIEKLLHELKLVLKESGMVYLSTPNKFSVINIISDPYSGLPFAALTTRGLAGKKSSKDFIRLYSLNQLKKFFSKLELHLNTAKSMQIIMNNKKIVESSSHPVWLKFLKATGLCNLLLKIINNKEGFINSYLTPTFYLILKN